MARPRLTHKRQHAFAVNLTEDEAKLAKTNAQGHSKKISVFARELVLGRHPRSMLDQQVVLDLAKASASYARVGNLLKMWLASGKDTAGLDIQAEINALNAARIELNQVAMKLLLAEKE